MKTMLRQFVTVSRRMLYIKENESYNQEREHYVTLNENYENGKQALMIANRKLYKDECMLQES